MRSRMLVCGQGMKMLWPRARPKEAIMLKTIAVILVVLWLLGFFLHFAGSLIHLLLVIALVVILFDLIARRRAVG